MWKQSSLVSFVFHVLANSFNKKLQLRHFEFALPDLNRCISFIFAATDDSSSPSPASPQPVKRKAATQEGSPSKNSKSADSQLMPAPVDIPPRVKRPPTIKLKLNRPAALLRQHGPVSPPPSPSPSTAGLTSPYFHPDVTKSQSPNVMPQHIEQIKIVPGMTMHVGEGSSDLTFTLSPDKQHVVLEKTVTSLTDGSSSSSSSDGGNEGRQEKRTLKLVKDQVDEMVEDLAILEDAVDYLHHETPVNVREIYYGDMHIVIDNCQNINDKNVEMRRFYRKDGKWERTRYGVNMRYREFAKILKMMEKAAPFMVKLQQKFLFSKRKNRYQ